MGKDLRTYLPDPNDCPSVKALRENPPADRANNWVITKEMVEAGTDNLIVPINEPEDVSGNKNDSNNAVTGPVIKTETPKSKGKGRGRRKLTEEAVRSIRNQADNGVTKDVLAKVHGVTVTCIWNIIKRNTWKHVA